MFINLVKSNCKQIRSNVIDFINDIFKFNQKEAQEAILKTGIIHKLLPMSCGYDDIINEHRVIIHIWANILELGGNEANALINDENKLHIIMKQLQYHTEKDIQWAFQCTFCIFKSESLSSKLINFENGILIDILCEKFKKIDSSNKASASKHLIKEFKIWPMIFDCFEEVILTMKQKDYDLTKFIVEKLRQNNIMQIFKELHLYDESINSFDLNWWNWSQYSETFTFMKIMIEQQ